MKEDISTLHKPDILTLLRHERTTNAPRWLGHVKLHVRSLVDASAWGQISHLFLTTLIMEIPIDFR